MSTAVKSLFPWRYNFLVRNAEEESKKYPQCPQKRRDSIQRWMSDINVLIPYPLDKVEKCRSILALFYVIHISVFVEKYKNCDRVGRYSI